MLTCFGNIFVQQCLHAVSAELATVYGMTIRRREFVPAHDAQKSCEIAVTVKAGRIAAINARRDIGIPTDSYRLSSGMESTCQRIFGL